MIRKAYFILLLFSVPLFTQNTQLETQWASGPCQQIHLTQTHAFAAFGNILAVIELSSNHIITQLELKNKIISFAAIDNMLYLSIYGDELMVLDISDCQYLKSQRCGIQTGEILIEKNYLITAHEQKLKIYDIQQRTKPVLLGELAETDYIWSLVIQNNILFYAAYDKGIGIVDIKNPASPQKIKNISTSNRAYCLWIHGNALFAGYYYWKGANIFNISDPVNPLLMKTLTEHYFCQMETVNNIMFVAARDFGMFTMNIASPFEPVLLQEYDFGEVIRLSINGQYLGIADARSGANFYQLDTANKPYSVFDYQLTFVSNQMFGFKNVLYVSDQKQGLKILECSNLAQIQDHGYWKQNAADIVFSDSVAYLARGAEAELWNIKNPVSPTFIKTIKLPYFGNRVFLHRNHAIFYSGVPDLRVKYGLVFVRVSEPNNPVIQSSISFDDPFQAMAVANALFVITRQKQLLRIDISDMSQPIKEIEPVIADSIAWGWEWNQIGYFTNPEDTVRVYDLQNPFKPVLKDKFYSKHFYSKPIFYQVTGYVGGFLGMNALNFSSPFSPRLNGFLNIPGYFASPTLVGSNIAVLKLIHEQKISFFNLSTPLDPHLNGRVNLSGSTSAIAARQNYVFAANGTGGLKVLDLSRTAQQEVAVVHGRNQIEHVTLQGDFAFMTANTAGLYIVDIRKPAAPGIVGHYYPATNMGSSKVILNRNFAYLIGGAYGFSVIDITDPTHPLKIGSTSAYSFSADGCTDGHYVYYGEYDQGLKIVDVRDPKQPVIASSIKTRGSANDVLVVDNIAYVAIGHGPLNPAMIQLFDITNRTNPIEVKTFEQTRGDFKALAWSQNYLIVAAGYAGLQLFDLSQSADLIPVGSFYTSGNDLIDVTVADGYLYAANANGGVLKISSALITSLLTEKNKQPSEFYLFPIYPNPFNATTLIHYACKQNTLVNLNVYNVKGQLVRTLVNENQQAGTYIVSWNGLDNQGQQVSSGIYLTRFIANDVNMVRKMVLVR